MDEKTSVYQRLDAIERTLDTVLATLQADAFVNAEGAPLNTNPLAGPARPLGSLWSAVGLPPKRGDGIYRITNGLPDPSGTPGAINSSVTAANLATTIGTPGWTALVRPLLAYSAPLKRQVMAEYGLADDPAKYEGDHLVPLCCGGHPTSPLNFWPQPRAGEWGAAVKDLTEVAGMHAILTGVMTLAEVQAGFMTNWIELHHHLFSNVKLMTLMAALPPPEPEP